MSMHFADLCFGEFGFLDVDDFRGLGRACIIAIISYKL